MTLPISHGYPDYARQLATADTVYVESLSQAIVNVQDYGLFFVGNQNALFAFGQTSTTATRFQFDFFGDQAKTALLWTYSVDLQPGDTSLQPIHVFGPWVNIKAVVFGGGGSTISFVVAGMPHYGLFAGSSVELAMFSHNNTAIGANVTFTEYTSKVFEGPVTWTSSCTATSWACTIQAQAIDGSIAILDYMDNTVVAYNRRQIYVPPMSIRFQLTNFDAAAKTFRIFATRGTNNT